MPPNVMRPQLASYPRRAVFRRLDVMLTRRRHAALRRLIRIWDTQGNDPTKWYPLNARMLFRNGYHERKSRSAHDTLWSLIRRENGKGNV
ncbi:MAG: hypothetical protein JSR47_18535 [Proteobacteria bacterium]|nr:hypothetical protein [Pseudomonadota bacterium]